jgi:exodeoxyribonuclease VII large subunit
VVPEVEELRTALVANRRRAALALRGLAERRAGQLDRLAERLRAAPALLLERRRAALDHTGARLQALSPLATLGRGYAIVRAGGELLRDSASVAAGDRIDVQLSTGGLAATVNEVAP